MRRKGEEAGGGGGKGVRGRKEQKYRSKKEKLKGLLKRDKGGRDGGDFFL